MSKYLPFVEGVTGAAFLYLLYYYIYFLEKFLRYRGGFRPFKGKVSVIIAAKNEAENLRRHIPQWLTQDYPHFELVIINDRSTDNTAEILKRWENHTQIRTVNIPAGEEKKTAGSKKNALTLGIQAARYPYLVFTDADCRPASHLWLARMAGGFARNKEIILGYGKYETLTGWLNALVRYETLTTALQYFGFALRGKPYMGVGRNLAYTKTLFLRHDGFDNHKEILSGDDDLFVNETATATNTGICYHPSAHTISVAPRSWKAWFRQKRRHYTTAPRYRAVHRFLLGGYGAARWIFLLGNTALWFMPGGRPAAAGMIFAWAVLHMRTVFKSEKKLAEKGLWWRSVVLEGILLLFQTAAFITTLFKKPQQWN